MSLCLPGHGAWALPSRHSYSQLLCQAPRAVARWLWRWLLPQAQLCLLGSRAGILVPAGAGAMSGGCSRLCLAGQ